MRSGQLHQSLHAFAIEAGQTLTAATASGAEVGFDIVEERARLGRPALYCYRPLTSQFVARQWQTLWVAPGMGRLEGVRAQEAADSFDSEGRKEGIRQFIDEKSYKPGLGSYDATRKAK